MKKITITTAIIIGMLLANTNHVQAQKQQGQVVINAGVGYSLLFSLLNVSANNASVSDKTMPVISTTVDYAIIDKFSLGLGIGYQSLTVYYTGYTNSVTGLPEDFSTSISRLNIGIRPLFHLGSSDKIDPYLGLRFGISLWNFSTTSNDPNYSNPGFSGTLPSFQALFGLQGYFSDHVGAHFELALGTPYFAEAGVSFKFGGASK